MPSPAQRARFRFSRFELQPTERRLLAAGNVVQLNARAFDLLLTLVERAGELVTKEELLQRVWPKLVVEESNLPVQMSALRRVLGTEAIETVPGHGYRFALEVAADDAQPSTLPHRHNLPRRLTSFVGQEDALATCARWLQTTRLLTLTGVGGLGKTRLSLELAEKLLPDFADGVWLVELAPLSDARLVPQAVASVLGLIEQPGTPVIQDVMKYVSGRRMLVILDNCEHLRHACAQVAQELLQAGPDVKVLASSREPLHVAGEAIFAVSSLAVPEIGRAMPLEALATEAVSLFVDRAAAANPAFRLTKSNAEAVGDVCTRLEGIPLAVELAAARIRVMSVDAIAQRLNDRFRLLKGGDPTALPRQQTLRATIDWSYELLTAQERVVFQRLAVFSGGWTLEAAEAVCGGGDIDPSDMLDLNGQLIEKSLVVMNAEGTRYRMLETVRQYAQERLDESGEGDATRTRHLDYFVLLAEKEEVRNRSPGAESETDRNEIERENFRSAYAWCDHAAGGAEAALRMASALRFWLCRGFFELGIPVMGDVLARPAVQARDLVRCNGLLAAGFVSYFRGRYDEARRYGEEGLSIARDMGATEIEARALTHLGMACWGQGDLAAARRYIVEGLARARVIGDRFVLFDPLNALAELFSIEGELDAAEPLYEEALQVARDWGSHHLTTVVLLNLARISISRGSTERARQLLREAMTVFEAMGSSQNAHAMLGFSAGLAALHGDWTRAARFYGASNRQLELVGLRREPPDEAAVATLIAQAREWDPIAFAAAETAGRELSCEDAVTEVKAWVESLG